MRERRKTLDTLERREGRVRPKKQAGRKTLLAFWAFLLLFVVTGTVLALRLLQYRSAQDEYARYRAMEEGAEVATASETVAAAPALAPQPTPEIQGQTTSSGGSVPVSTADAPPTPTPKPFYSAKVSALRRDNPDTVAWLEIPGTQLQYPVVQGKDNEYYMTHTFQKKENDSGAIFLDCWNAPDFTDFNTVVYGHNMKDGSMFAGLRDYRYQWFADKYQTIEMTQFGKKLRYQVFSAYTSQGEDVADFRGQDCATDEQRSAFIKAVRKRAEIDSRLTVRREDRLLTLVTCTGGDHPWFWVVHAVLVEEQLTQPPPTAPHGIDAKEASASPQPAN